MQFRLGYLWAFLSPLLQLSGLYLIWVFLRHNSTGLPLIALLITGVLPYRLFRETMAGLSRLEIVNRNILVIPHVTPFDAAYALIIFEYLTMLMVFLLISLLMHYLEVDPDVDDVLGVLLAFCLMSCFGAGIGMTIAGLSRKIKSANKLALPLFGAPVFLTSGPFFTASMLPATAREWLLYNPLLHVTEYMRSSYFKGFESPYYDLHYAGSFAFVLLVLGFATMRVNLAEPNYKIDMDVLDDSSA